MTMTAPGNAGPKRRRRKADRPGEIIEAGLLEFAENGFAATRLDDVAKRAGVAKGTIYLYFANKEALFEAALRSRVGGALGDVDAAIEAYPGPTEDLLRLVVRTIYAELVESDLRVLARIIIAEGGRFPAITALYHRVTIARGRDIMRRIMQRGIERGEFRDGPIAEMPLVLMAPAIMAAVWKMTFEPHEPLDLDKVVAAHLDLVLNGVRAKA